MIAMACMYDFSLLRYPLPSSPLSPSPSVLPAPPFVPLLPSTPSINHNGLTDMSARFIANAVAINLCLATLE